MPNIQLSEPQYKFVTSDAAFKAFVAGYGGGKTFAGATELLSSLLKYPGIINGYFAPTYAQIADIFYPSISDVAERHEVTATIKESKKEVHIRQGRMFFGVIKCRSMEDPSKIVGFEIARAAVDELDTLPAKKAMDVWRKILGRCRLKCPGLKNGISVTTTPEGFRATHKLFVSDLAEHPEKRADYLLVQASTLSNKCNLSAGYIQSLYDAYPEEYVNAYIHGEFVNLTSGRIYRQFNRKKCASTQVLLPADPVKRLPGDTLHIGMDFNVEKMAACILVQRNEVFHCVAELKKILDTPEMIRIIKSRWPGHAIYVYPDASGGSRKTENASQTDLALLRNAGFIVKTDNKNPSVKDRILSVNSAFEKGRLKINDWICTETASCLEKQCYDDNGEPDKKSGHDHQNDALGYAVHGLMPVVRHKMTVEGTK
jgi:hypothetical protein